jgi:DNA polymerase-3 subunit epsilon
MLVVDVETTGIAPSRHSIVSIGAVDFAYPANQFYRECRPFEGAEVDAGALEVNGFTLEQLSDTGRPRLLDALHDFLSWARGCNDQTLAGQNTFFDRDFLELAVHRYHLEWPFGRRIIDLHSVCYTHMLTHGKRPPMKEQRADLTNDRILKYVGLPEEPRPHHALTGAKMEAEAFSRLLYGRSLLQEFELHPLPEWARDSGEQRVLF